MITEYADARGPNAALTSLAARLGCTVAEAEQRLIDGRAADQLRSAAPPQGVDCGCAACDARYRPDSSIDAASAEGKLKERQAPYRAGGPLQGTRAYRQIVERRDRYCRDGMDGVDAYASIMARRAR